MTRHGMTLVEVLASTILLTIIAGACVPLLRRATQAAAPESDEISLDALGRFADSHIDTLTGESEVTERELPWPGVPERSPVQVRLLRRDGAATDDHAWLAFSHGRWTLLRWVGTPSDSGSEAPVTPIDGDAGL